MSWPDPPRGPTDPAYYSDAATSLEAEVRADFALYRQLREIAPYGETPEQQQELTARADELAATRGRSESVEARTLWGQLQAAVAGYEARPETTRQLFARLDQAKAAGDLPVDELAWRNLRQAAEVTGHLETTVTGSDQDGARWQPPQRSRTREAQRPTLFDRALGGRGPELTTLTEVDAVIAETDRLLAIEEELGDLNRGEHEHTDLLPERLRPPPGADTHTGEPDRESAQITALREVQDFTAEHARLVENWDSSPEHDQAHIARLESLLAAARTARTTAADAGVALADIEAVYLAGREGTYWHQQPGDPQLANRDRPVSEPDPLPEGAEIEAAIEAAMPEGEAADWSAEHAEDATAVVEHRDLGVDVAS
ncbi:hypothetical protein [Nocardia xishanensis]|uniref:hypothetical protein n=1 Tax=Nocardia xishanensis TaxID=238964 RepID=UPI0008363CA2|nr:hypothetical protein [Nocardia xishanensis]